MSGFLYLVRSNVGGAMDKGTALLCYPTVF
jgi:hypothetical protein